jgi:hypothetical protein
MIKQKKSSALTSELVLVEKSNTKTATITDVRDTCLSIGDRLADAYNKTEDVRTGVAALYAYKTAIAAVKMQLIHDKMTNTPSKIEFFETE